jgi:PD-(D/E)XK nuclease superfamily
MSKQTQQPNPPCPKCPCKSTTRRGKRRNRLRTLQLFQCPECLHRFTGEPGKNRTYPLRLILDAISTFNLGYSITDTRSLLRRRFHVDVPDRTINSWLTAYRSLATYARLRAQGKKLYDPGSIIVSRFFEHRQVYRFQVHNAKLELSLQPPIHRHVAPLRGYLTTVQRDFPHQLFQNTAERSSTFPAALHPAISRKENHATRSAALVLPTSPNNKKRHETLQRFMIVNDSVTVAVEIPVYLTRDDIGYYRSRGFDLDFDSDVITGHIDFLQIRNGHIHILDYKPDARKEKHAHVQLTIYALALARRTGLPLKFFKCGWFDEKDYFEFFPLQAVYKRRS